MLSYWFSKYTFAKIKARSKLLQRPLLIGGPWSWVSNYQTKINVFPLVSTCFGVVKISRHCRVALVARSFMRLILLTIVICLVSSALQLVILVTQPIWLGRGWNCTVDTVVIERKAC